MGVEPGLADVFARFAADHLFSEIDEIGIRAGANLVVDGYGLFAPSFSIWTTNEECLNPPVIWERERGWFTTAPFLGAEAFDFPGGIGPVERVSVEHEEVLLVPRWIDCKRVTFKYGLGEGFIDVLQTLHRLGLDRTESVLVKGAPVSPRALVAAILPDPSTLGERMCGVQAVLWQTAMNPVIALELLATGQWMGVGVLGPEAFDAVPYLDLMRTGHGQEYGLRET